MITRAALEHKPALASLMTPYAAELQIHGVIGDPSKFLDRYWSEPDRHPYLIQAQDHPVGFALVNKHALSDAPVDAVMAEFYVAASARRQGWGIRAAHAAFAAHPGQWELWVADKNPAAGFWARATEGFANLHTIPADDGLIYRFTAESTLS